MDGDRVDGARLVHHERISPLREVAEGNPLRRRPRARHRELVLRVACAGSPRVAAPAVDGLLGELAFAARQCRKVRLWEQRTNDGGLVGGLVGGWLGGDRPHVARWDVSRDRKQGKERRAKESHGIEANDAR